MFRNDSIEDLRRDLEIVRGRVTALADALIVSANHIPEGDKLELFQGMQEMLESLHGSDVYEGYRVELEELKRRL
ncbi:hypothetical protein ACULMA_17305 [Xanthomonas arboricola pv. corylina]|uniref:hypothetical protein n=1 Tax=Xanthomonas arboricola TaxID=56448 RepID=UPI004040BDC6